MGRPTGGVALTLNPALVGNGTIQAWETDGCERRLGELLVEGSSVRFAMGAFAIKTIELQLGSVGEQVLLGAKEPLRVDGDAWIHQGLLLHHTYQDIPGAARVGSGSRGRDD